MTQSIIVLRGLPGSGKTTWARAYLAANSGHCRVSKDDLRAMLYDGRYTAVGETLVLDCQEYAITTALMRWYSVIVDDTNLTERSMLRIHRIADAYRRPVQVVPVVFETSVDECIRRDAQRAQPVGAQRIREMAEYWYRELYQHRPTAETRTALAQIDTPRPAQASFAAP